MTDNDRLLEKISQMAVDIAEIKTKLAMMPSPPKQPCQWHDQLRKEFDEHVKEHKQYKSDWRKAILDAAIDIAKTAVIAAGGIIAGLLIGGIF